MLQAAYYATPHRVLLVDGPRQDYDQLAALIEQFVSSQEQQALLVPVISTGEAQISKFVFRKHTGPNRVSYEPGQITYSIAAHLLEQFLSRIQFPADEHLPVSVKLGQLRYHHHYEYIEEFDPYIASDSLPVVFSLISEIRKEPI
jgi:hypothetical protein